jgi:hypothetical protein
MKHWERSYGIEYRRARLESNNCPRHIDSGQSIHRPNETPIRTSTPIRWKNRCSSADELTGVAEVLDPRQTHVGHPERVADPIHLSDAKKLAWSCARTPDNSLMPLSIPHKELPPPSVRPRQSTGPAWRDITESTAAAIRWGNFHAACQ